MITIVSADRLDTKDLTSRVFSQPNNQPATYIDTADSPKPTHTHPCAVRLDAYYGSKSHKKHRKVSYKAVLLYYKLVEIRHQIVPHIIPCNSHLITILKSLYDIPVPHDSRRQTYLIYFFVLHHRGQSYM